MTHVEYPGPLQLGDSGENTRKLQQRLQERGYRLEHADGEFGPITERAVKKFQEYAKTQGEDLEVDGIVGPKTHAALYHLPVTE